MYTVDSSRDWSCTHNLPKYQCLRDILCHWSQGPRPNAHAEVKRRLQKGKLHFTSGCSAPWALQTLKV